MCFILYFKVRFLWLCDGDPVGGSGQLGVGGWVAGGGRRDAGQREEGEETKG